MRGLNKRTPQAAIFIVHTKDVIFFKEKNLILAFLLKIMYNSYQIVIY